MERLRGRWREIERGGLGKIGKTSEWERVEEDCQAFKESDQVGVCQREGGWVAKGRIRCGKRGNREERPF